MLDFFDSGRECSRAASPGDREALFRRRVVVSVYWLFVVAVVGDILVVATKSSSEAAKGTSASLDDADFLALGGE